MTISIVGLLVMILLIVWIIRGSWILAFILILIIAYSSAQYAGDIRVIWDKLSNTTIKL